MTRTPRATASRTKLPPMNPAPPVTSQVAIAPPAPCAATSERNVVVAEVVGEVGLGGRARGVGVATRRAAALGALAAFGARFAASFATAAEHLHLVGDDVGVVALLPVLAG